MKLQPMLESEHKSATIQKVQKQRRAHKCTDLSNYKKNACTKRKAHSKASTKLTKKHFIWSKSNTNVSPKPLTEMPTTVRIKVQLPKKRGPQKYAPKSNNKKKRTKRTQECKLRGCKFVTSSVLSKIKASKVKALIPSVFVWW